MSYISDSLVPGETLVHDARVSWWSQVGLVLLAALAFGIAIGFGAMARLDSHAERLVAGVIALVGLALLLRAWVHVHSTELAITNRRVIAKFGFVRRHTVEINIDQVEALHVDQGIWGRILNFGTIQVTGTGTSVDPFPHIADPLVFRRKFMEATNRPLTTARG